MNTHKFVLQRENKENFERTSEIVEAGTIFKLPRAMEPLNSYFIAHLGPVRLTYLNEHARQFRWGYTWDNLMGTESDPAHLLEVYGRTTTLNFINYQLAGTLARLGEGENFTLHEARWNVPRKFTDDTPIDYKRVSQFGYPSRIPWINGHDRRYGFAEEHEKHVKLRKISGETRNYSKDKLTELHLAPENDEGKNFLGEIALIIAMDRTKRNNTLLTSEFAIVRAEGLYESGNSLFRVVESEDS